MRTAVRRWILTHPQLVDVALAGAAYPMSLMAFGVFFSGLAHAHPHPTLRDALFALAATLPLLGRRAAPLRVLGAVVAICALFQLTGEAAPLVPPLAVAVYSVAVRTDRRTTWFAAGLVVVCCIAPALVWAPGPPFGPLRLGALTWIGLAAAIGDSVRNHRAHLAALERRATRAEHGRDEEAARRVTAERLRIARELHDVVAHELTLINAQSAVCVHLGQRDPAIVADVLADVRDHSKQALDELRAIVGLLTQPGDNAAPREPVRGLHHLDSLVESFARAGLRVEVREEGERRGLPPAVDVAGFRIVQEALTNVRKHASVPEARVRLGFGRDALRITVENDGSLGRGGPGSGTIGGSGRGLIGIRERATAMGGQVVSGPGPTGGFTVDARLPLATESAG